MFKHPRIYYPNLPQSGEITISGEKYFHLARSVRARPGDTFQLFNGDGLFTDAEIVSIDSSNVYAKILKTTEVDNLPKVRLTLAFGLLPAEPLKTLLAGATQLGVREFVPFSSVFNDIRIPESRIEKMIDRWRKIIIENSSVAGRSHLPVIHSPVLLSDLVMQSEKFDYRYAFWEEGGENWRDYLPLTSVDAIVVIGPKGGLHDSEVELLKKVDFKILSLGELILKAEYAAITAVARIIGE